MFYKVEGYGTRIENFMLLNSIISFAASLSAVYEDRKITPVSFFVYRNDYLGSMISENIFETEKAVSPFPIGNIPKCGVVSPDRMLTRMPAGARNKVCCGVGSLIAEGSVDQAIIALRKSLDCVQ